MKRKALGRGLSALLSDMPVADIGKNSIQEIDPNQIETNQFQPRINFDDIDLQELAESVKTHGILQPLLVRQHPDKPERYQLIAGERRLRASKRVGLEKVPCILLETEEAEMLEIALVENIQRSDLNVVEEAKAYKHLAERFSLTQEQIASRVGKSRESVANALRLLNLPEQTLLVLNEGMISTGHAKCLLSLKSEEEIEKLTQDILDFDWSVRETEKRVRELLKSQDHQSSQIENDSVSKQKGEDLYSADLKRTLEENFQTKVRIRYRGKDRKKGTIEVEFFDLDHLQALLGRWGISLD